jgi:hypothetical protein
LTVNIAANAPSCATKVTTASGGAEGARESDIKVELLELAAICEEIANGIEDRMTAG